MISSSKNNSIDYLTDDYRRIFPINGKIELENKIFKEQISLCLTDSMIEISIKNCEFEKGLNIRRGKIDKNYKLFIFKSKIKQTFSLITHDNKNEILE